MTLRAVRGYLMHQRARLAQHRHPELGEVSAYCFYATRLRFGQLAFDIGANHGQHLTYMVRRGARVVAVEPQEKLASELSVRYPAAIVLPVAIGDVPGRAMLHLPQESDDLASLDASWAENCELPLTWKTSVEVPVTTLDALIREYGCPEFVKIDTEGFEDHVLGGLNQPIDHILFEVHATLAGVAARAVKRIESLGRYDFMVAPLNSWRFIVTSPRELLANLPVAADVYARRVH
jgi:FkbM family methyltransferase